MFPWTSSKAALGCIGQSILVYMGSLWFATHDMSTVICQDGSCISRYFGQNVRRYLQGKTKSVAQRPPVTTCLTILLVCPGLLTVAVFLYAYMRPKTIQRPTLAVLKRARRVGVSGYMRSTIRGGLTRAGCVTPVSAAPPCPFLFPPPVFPARLDTRLSLSLGPSTSLLCSALSWAPRMLWRRTRLDLCTDAPQVAPTKCAPRPRDRIMHR